jgi:hypothetical protein
VSDPILLRIICVSIKYAHDRVGEKATDSHPVEMSAIGELLPQALVQMILHNCTLKIERP